MLCNEPIESKLCHVLYLTVSLYGVVFGYVSLVLLECMHFSKYTNVNRSDNCYAI